MSKKISDLTAATIAQTTDLLEIERPGAPAQSMKLTVQQLVSLMALSGDVTTVGSAATVNKVGGALASDIASAAALAAAAGAADIGSTLVKRDSSGNFSAGTISANLAGNASSATSATSAGSFTGALAGDVSGTQGATSVDSVGGATAAHVASATAAALNATDANTAGVIVKRDASGNFSAGTITAALAGNASTASHATSADSATNANNFSGSLSGDVSGSQASTAVNSVGGASASDIAAATAIANAATSVNTPSAAVKRDASGNFSAGTITAALAGNASTATYATTAGSASSSAGFSGSLSGDVSGTQGSTVVTSVGGKTAASVANAVDATASLQSSLSAETSARTSADNTLQSHIDSEASARAAADSLLIPITQKGAAGGVAPLDGNAKIAATYLPSYVDEVLPYNNLAAFPASGATNAIYIADDTNKVYRWSGTSYIEISPSPGSTDSVAEGSANLYFTNARAAAAAPVQSVAGKTGAVVVSKSDVGLGSVPNVDATAPSNIVQDSTHRFTSDAEKSTWNGKQDALGYTAENAANKATSLASPDNIKYPTTSAVSIALSSKYDASNPAGYVTSAQAASAAPVQSVAGRTGAVTLTSADVGLANVNNTSDANKPVSTAQQAALDLKANLASPALTGTPTAPTATSGTNTTQVATTAFVTSALSGVSASGFSVTALNTLAAGNTITLSSTQMFQSFEVRSTAGTGAITLSSTPFGASSYTAGMMVRLMGVHDTDTVTITNSSATNACVLQGSATLLLGYVIDFQYSNNLLRWVEVNRNF